MFEQYLGKDAFRRGVTLYLSKHAHGHGTYHDFVAALSEGAGQEAAASIRALVDLIGKLLVPGPFFRLIQWLKLKKTLVRYYNYAGNPRQGRQKVLRFVNRRLPSIYPGMGEAERAEIEGRVEDLLDQLDAAAEKENGGEQRRIYRA